MASISLTWHAVMDDRTCPICMALDGYTWTFETGADTFGDYLTHPTYGVVWDVHRGSKAHGHIGANCRCDMSHETDMKDLLTQTKILQEMMVDVLRNYRSMSIEE